MKIKNKKAQMETGLPGWLLQNLPWIVLFVIALIAIAAYFAIFKVLHK